MKKKISWGRAVAAIAAVVFFMPAAAAWGQEMGGGDQSGRGMGSDQQGYGAPTGMGRGNMMDGSNDGGQMMGDRQHAEFENRWNMMMRKLGQAVQKVDLNYSSKYPAIKEVVVDLLDTFFDGGAPVDLGNPPDDELVANMKSSINETSPVLDGIIKEKNKKGVASLTALANLLRKQISPALDLISEVASISATIQDDEFASAKEEIKAMAARSKAESAQRAANRVNSMNNNGRSQGNGYGQYGMPDSTGRSAGGMYPSGQYGGQGFKSGNFQGSQGNYGNRQSTGPMRNPTEGGQGYPMMEGGMPTNEEDFMKRAELMGGPSFDRVAAKEAFNKMNTNTGGRSSQFNGNAGQQNGEGNGQYGMPMDRGNMPSSFGAPNNGAPQMGPTTSGFSGGSAGFNPDQSNPSFGFGDSTRSFGGVTPSMPPTTNFQPSQPPMTPPSSTGFGIPSTPPPSTTGGSAPMPPSATASNAFSTLGSLIWNAFFRTR